MTQMKRRALTEGLSSRQCAVKKDLRVEYLEVEEVVAVDQLMPQNQPNMPKSLIPMFLRCLLVAWLHRKRLQQVMQKYARCAKECSVS